MTGFKLFESKKRWAKVFLVGLLLFFSARPASAEAQVALEVFGPGVSTKLTFTLPELETMDQYQHVYSAVNTYPTKQWYVARGVKLRDLLALAGLKNEAGLVRFYSRDGYDVTFTIKELMDKRFYFPGLKENHPTDGSIPGSSEGAVEVEPILAIHSVEGSDNPDHMNDKDTLLLVLGQRAVTEQVSPLYVKKVNRIEVLTAEPEKWDEPRLNIPSGSALPPGTELVLENKSSDTDKIYYTTDGSTPTVDSPIFNWSARRWWPLRGDVDKVNPPIRISDEIVSTRGGQDVVVIKARTIGPGKEDSDVVTFTFIVDPAAVDPTLEPGGPVTGLALDRSQIDLPLGGSFRLRAEVEPFNARDEQIIWRSNDPRIATVDTKGLVTVVGPGTAIISAETADGSFRASCVINGPPEQKKEDEAEEKQALTEAPAVADPPSKRELLPDRLLEPGAKTDDVPIPPGPYRYLAPKEELLNHSPGEKEGAAENPAPGIRVFELYPIEPVALVGDSLDLYSALIFLLLLFVGASKKYVEYEKGL